MDIKAISTLTLPKSTFIQTAPQTQIKEKKEEVSKPENFTQQTTDNKPSKNFKKALPYAAGVVVLAGLGFYLLRGRGKSAVDKNLKETAKEELKEELKEIGEEIKEELMEAPKTVKETVKEVFDFAQAEAKAAEDIKKVKLNISPDMLRGDARLFRLPEGTKYLPVLREGSPNFAAEKALVVGKTLEHAKKSINISNSSIIDKITKNKQAKAAETDRIIAENIKDGHIDFNIMRKVAQDFSIDKTGRGEDRYHQAANILEQSYVREFIKTEGNDRFGLAALYENMKNDKTLLAIYRRMPLEESVNRMNYLRNSEFYNLNPAKDKMTADEFFEKTFEMLVENILLKKW